jgi:hypothetical protein
MSKMSMSDSGDKTDIPDGDGSWSQRSTTCSNHLAPLSVPYAFASTKMGVLFLLSCGFRPIAEGGSQSIAVNKQVSLTKSCSFNLSHRDVGTSPPNVCYWHLADILFAELDVHF